MAPAPDSTQATPDPAADSAAVPADAGELYAADRASQGLGMRLLEVRAGFARLQMHVRDDMLNGHRICHGGFIFCLADSAFAFACNAGRPVTVAAAVSIEFLRPARQGAELIATAQERSRGRRTGVYDIEVRELGGECIALARGRSHELTPGRRS